MTVRRVEFDSTVDELVDVNMRLVEDTAAYRRPRRQSQWTVGVCVAGGVAFILLRWSAAPSLAVLAFVLCVALVGGAAAGISYGWYYDRYVRQHYRRMLNEMYGGEEAVHWEFEVRQDILWTRSKHAEVVFPWSRLRRIRDVPGSIELWFDPGLTVVRDRAFSSLEDRRAFLDAVRRYLPDQDAV